MTDCKMSLEACAKALVEARISFNAVKQEKDRIDRSMATATNTLNDAQKAFDAAVAEMKKDAPWSTHWHNVNRNNSERNV